MTIEAGNNASNGVIVCGDRLRNGSGITSRIDFERAAERHEGRSHAEALVIPENLVAWLAEVIHLHHGWTQLCSHGRQFTRPRQGTGLAHTSMELEWAIAPGGSGSWRLRRRWLGNLAN